MYKLSRYNITIPLDDGGALLANTLWQSQLRLSQFEAQALSSTNTAPTEPCLGKELYTRLLDGGMLAPQETEELDVARHHHYTERRDSDSLYLTIVNTLGCNFDCSYCGELHKRPQSLSKEDERQILRFTDQQLASRRSLQVVWTGGEPLLNIKSIQYLSQTLSRMCSFRGTSYSASLVTNGALMTDQVAQLLRRSQIRTVRITLDGPRDARNVMRPAKNRKESYDQVLSGLKVANSYFDVGLGINLGKRNGEVVEQLLQDLVDHELSGIGVFFSRIVPPDLRKSSCIDTTAEFLTVSEFAELEVRLARAAIALGFHVDLGFGQNGALPCSAVSRDQYVVEPGGLVQRCYSDISSGSTTVGTLVGGKFEPGVNDKKWEHYDAFDDSCRECAYLPICYGGCPKLQMNNINKEWFICTPRKFNLAELLKLCSIGDKSFH